MAEEFFPSTKNLASFLVRNPYQHTGAHQAIQCIHEKLCFFPPRIQYFDPSSSPSSPGLENGRPIRVTRTSRKISCSNMLARVCLQSIGKKNTHTQFFLNIHHNMLIFQGWWLAVHVVAVADLCCLLCLLLRYESCRSKVKHNFKRR